MTDPISDFLTRIRNASRAGREQCVAQYSKLRESLLAILKAEGFIRGYEVSKDERGHKTLVVQLKYVDQTPAITDIQRVSRPGRRIYFGSTEIPRVLGGLGISILTTPKGIMNDREARRNKLGGELICNVW